MPKASDLSPDSRFVGLFVGRSGSGKTVAACSFPGPIHVNDFDGRIRGILGAPWIDKSNITYDYFPPKGDGLIPEINKKLEVIAIQGKVGQLTLKTLITDSLTSQNFAFLCQSIPLTHNNGKGKWLGPISMPGPEDYGLEAQACYDYMAYLKSIPIPNIITSAHIVDRYGKADPTNAFSESIVIGSKLSVRDKIGENVQTHFDHVFFFEEINDKFYVTFHGSGIARTSYVGLPNGRFDITGKSFYEELMRLTSTQKEKTNVAT